MSILKSLQVFIASLLVAAASWINPVVPVTPVAPAQLGSFNPVQAQKFKLSGSGITSSAASITVQSFNLPDGSTNITMSDLGSIAYGTLEPGTTKEEQISFTGVTHNANGTATLTGATRGLDFRSSVCTAVAGNQKSHAGGTIFILSNTACFYSQFDISKNNESITGTWTFASSAIPRLDSAHVYGAGDEEKFVTYRQLASTSFSGTVDSSLSQKGVVEIATPTELAAGTLAGDSTAPLVAQSSNFNSTAQTSTTAVVANTLENSVYKISPTFIATTTAPYVWGGIHTFNGATTVAGTLSVTGSSTIASTTFTGIPFIPITTPTLPQQVVSKSYLGTLAPLYLNDNAFVDNGAGGVATSTFTLSNAGRVNVILRGFMLNTTGGDGCAISLLIDGVQPADWATTTITSATNNARQNIGTTYISASLSAALHTIVASTTVVTGGTCASGARLTTQFAGQ
jgi:hypothetical protein